MWLMLPTRFGRRQTILHAELETVPGDNSLGSNAGQNAGARRRKQGLADVVCVQCSSSIPGTCVPHHDPIRRRAHHVLAQWVERYLGHWCAVSFESSDHRRHLCSYTTMRSRRRHQTTDLPMSTTRMTLSLDAITQYVFGEGENANAVGVLPERITRL